jgi:hypothetical protein
MPPGGRSTGFTVYPKLSDRPRQVLLCGGLRNVARNEALARAG